MNLNQLPREILPRYRANLGQNDEFIDTYLIINTQNVNFLITNMCFHTLSPKILGLSALEDTRPEEDI